MKRKRGNYLTLNLYIRSKTQSLGVRALGLRCLQVASHVRWCNAYCSNLNMFWREQQQRQEEELHRWDAFQDLKQRSDYFLHGIMKMKFTHDQSRTKSLRSAKAIFFSVLNLENLFSYPWWKFWEGMDWKLIGWWLKVLTSWDVW